MGFSAYGRASRLGAPLAASALVLVALEACSIYDPALLEEGKGGSGAAGGSGEGAGPASSSSTGEPVACASPSECPGQDGFCGTRDCVSGICDVDARPAGEALPATAQVAGDCKRIVCDGEGGQVTEPDPADLFDDGNPCTADACEGDVSTNTPLPLKTPCENGVCSADARCVRCVDGSDCASQICTDQETCAASGCGDGAKNGSETDVDCGGGGCSPCPTGDACAKDGDCVSGNCAAGKCAPSCTDGVKNAGESDVDCGGTKCAPCDVGQACGGGADCVTGSCVSGFCACTGKHLVISEVRTRGLGGGSDEFVELYNPTGTDVVLDEGWTLEVRSAESLPGGSYGVRWTGSGHTIGARRHYLVAHDGYAQSPARDAELSGGLPDAASLVLRKGSQVVDAVCFAYGASSEAKLLSGEPPFVCEGKPASNLPHNNTTQGESNSDASIERRPGGVLGNCVDTGSSAGDFRLLAPAKPQNRSSPPTP